MTRVPGSIGIHQIAPDGRVLVQQDNSRLSAVALGPGQNQERDLTITDLTFVYAISRDGSLALLGEQGSDSHPDYDIYVRPTDGSARVRVGDGEGRDFSHDMKWVLTTLTSHIPSQFFLVPLGPGELKQIT